MKPTYPKKAYLWVADRRFDASEDAVESDMLKFRLGADWRNALPSKTIPVLDFGPFDGIIELPACHPKHKKP